MNATALRSSLRTAGLERIGRRLPSYLLEHGVPCLREGHGLTARIELEHDGALCVRVLTKAGWLLVADERRVHLTLEELKKKMEPANTGEPQRPYSISFRPDLVKRLDKYAAGTGLSRSRIVAKAVAEYLEKRGG